ncbi:SIR2 family protein [Archangium sp.]|jgi:hypothetical protein|uniref:SIR2 family NAD-dependent protein deacylase n=1 Tax=Archangium sp. TaxID=1872627 RepID=UPI002EDA3594
MRESMTFDDILPHLVDGYRRGVLVPFIGSGMSRPVCTDWLSFLVKLADEAGVEVPESLRTGTFERFIPSDLYRLADKAVHRLRPRNVEERANAYRRALRARGGSTGPDPIPPQTEALARLPWPLVLTTNYDDLVVQSSRVRHANAGLGATEVLGRSVEDCHKVIRSLDAPSQPILWAVQGFLGGQAAPPEESVPESRRRDELVDQLVVGHQQYQNATNAQPHFRRAFAEVFHRRSFLFLGSSVLEDYLVNLFGEITHHYGPGPHPHFALLPGKQRQAFDPQFLQTRLGVVPIFYEDYSAIPEWLGALSERLLTPSVPTGASASRRPVAWMADELGFSLSDGPRPPSGGVRRVKLRYAELPVPSPGGGRCVIASLGRDKGNVPLVGSQARALLEKSTAAGLVADPKAALWKGLDAAPSYVYQYGDAPILGVSARDRRDSTREADRRDLGIIPEAVCAVLRAANEAGFREVHLGPVASGRLRLWHQLHPFVQTLVGIRQFFASTSNLVIETLELHVFESAVWLSILSGKVPVSEILSSDVTKIWVDIRDAAGTPEIQAVTVRGPTTVGDIKTLCGLEPARWRTEILPRPSTEPIPSSGEDELMVAPTSLVIFSPR